MRRSRAAPRTLRVVAWLAGSLAFGCAQYSSTTRLIEGREIVGRPITPAAYAAYLHAATLEAAGYLKEAAAEYERARDHDPNSPEIQTALGRVICPFDYPAAEEEFAKALELDESYEPAHRERARCALRHGHKQEALRHARQALRAGPLEPAATHVLAEALRRNGEHQEASRLLQALRTLHGDRTLAEPVPAHSRLTAPAKQKALGDKNTPSDARRATALDPPTQAADEETVHATIRLIIRSGQDEEAEDLALQHRVSRVTFGQLALLEGRPDLALEQGQLVLFADPKNSDARILALWSAALLADRRAYEAALVERHARPELPEPEGAAQLERLLRLRVGPQAAAIWRQNYEATRQRRDDPEPHQPAGDEMTPDAASAANDDQ